jgi:hypothetical protein
LWVLRELPPPLGPSAKTPLDESLEFSYSQREMFGEMMLVFDLLSFSHGHRHLSADRTVEDDENDGEQEFWKLGGDGEREGSKKRKNIGGR